VGSPRWSPDSRWIAFDSTKADRNDIFVVSAGGGPPRLLTPGPARNSRPSWSRKWKVDLLRLQSRWRLADLEGAGRRRRGRAGNEGRWRGSV
jgi:Tol biopolymer transport system component